MTMTVRLGPRSERTLNALAKRRGVSRSDVVREALARYGAADTGATPFRPYDAWQDVLGIVAIGARDPDRTTGDQFADRLRTSPRRRRAR